MNKIYYKDIPYKVGGDSTLVEATITERGETSASDFRADGFSKVNVNVPYTDVHYAKDDIVSFEGEDFPLKSLTADITALQDLHGYDYPWVGGAGKNKFDKSTVNVDKYIGADGQLATSQYNQDVTDFIPVTSGQSYIINSSISTDYYSCFYDENENVVGSVFANNQFPKVAPSDAKYIRVTFAKADINTFMVEQGTTASSTYYPYSNECPIIGWSAVDVTNMDDISDKTFFDGLLNGTYGIVDLGTLDWQYSSISERFYVSASDLGVKATDVSTPFNAISSALIAKSYNEIEAKTVDNAIGINPNATQLFARYSSITSASDFITAMNGVHLIYELATPTTPTITPTEFSNILAEFGINGSTITIQLGDTYYGAKLDVVSGVLTVDKGYVDLGTLNYTYYSGNLFTASISNLKPISNKNLCNALCSIYVAKKGTEYASIDGSFVAGFNTSHTLAIHDSRFTDATAFKTAMNGVQLVYELATPLTYQLSKQQIRSLVGENNIFADTGEVAVEWQTLYQTP